MTGLPLSLQELLALPDETAIVRVALPEAFHLDALADLALRAEAAGRLGTEEFPGKTPEEYLVRRMRGSQSHYNWFRDIRDMVKDVILVKAGERVRWDEIAAEAIGDARARRRIAVMVAEARTEREITPTAGAAPATGTGTAVVDAGTAPATLPRRRARRALGSSGTGFSTTAHHERMLAAVESEIAEAEAVARGEADARIDGLLRELADAREDAAAAWSHQKESAASIPAGTTARVILVFRVLEANDSTSHAPRPHILLGAYADKPAADAAVTEDIERCLSPIIKDTMAVLGILRISHFVKAVPITTGAARDAEPPRGHDGSGRAVRVVSPDTGMVDDTVWLQAGQGGGVVFCKTTFGEPDKDGWAKCCKLAEGHAAPCEPSVALQTYVGKR